MNAVIEDATLLVVDDRPENIFIIEQLLEHHMPRCRLLTATGAERGLEMARAHAIDAALVDVQMAGIDGLEMVRRLKADPRTATFPVVLITAHRSDARLRARALTAGADEFITRPIDSVEMVARIQVMLRIKAAEDELRQLNAGLARQVEERTEQLRLSEARARALLDASADAAFLVAADGTVLDVNESTARMTGRSREAIIGQAACSMCPEEIRALWQARFDGIMTTGQSIRAEDEVGSDTWDVGMTPVLDSSDKPVQVAVFARDITARRTAERERTRLQEQLNQAQKLQALGTLAGGISHDFNNILQAMTGYVEMMYLDLECDHPCQEDLERMGLAIDRARALVRQILTFGRRLKPHLKPVVVASIVDEAVTLLRASMPSNIDIYVTAPDPSYTVRADAGQLHQVVMNLATNAAQAMRGNGGQLDFEMRAITIPDGDSTGLPAGRYCQLTVTDTGPGMSEELQQRIFEPFFTTKGRGKGTGLGLSTVHGIVNSLGGTITVDSAPNRGTRFTVCLALHTGDEPTLSTPKESTAEGSEHVLLVDDEQPVIDVTERMLSHLGYRVTGAASGTEALRLFLATPDTYDVVITDLHMPDMQGDELARHLQSARPSIPVILATSEGDSLQQQVSVTTHIAGHITKPARASDLGLAIREAVTAPKPQPTHADQCPRNEPGAD